MASFGSGPQGRCNLRRFAFGLVVAVPSSNILPDVSALAKSDCRHARPPSWQWCRP